MHVQFLRLTAQHLAVYYNDSGQGDQAAYFGVDDMLPGRPTRK